MKISAINQNNVSFKSKSFNLPKKAEQVTDGIFISKEALEGIKGLPNADKIEKFLLTNKEGWDNVVSRVQRLYKRFTPEWVPKIELTCLPDDDGSVKVLVANNARFLDTNPVGSVVQIGFNPTGEVKNESLQDVSLAVLEKAFEGNNLAEVMAKTDYELHYSKKK